MKYFQVHDARHNSLNKSGLHDDQEMKSPMVERVLVVRHPVVRFWSTWNQKFLKGQVIGRDICNRSELSVECDKAENDDQKSHLASFKEKI